MKAKHAVVLVALILSVIFGSIYMKFFSKVDATVKIYVCQVGIYKETENADAMKAQLTALQLPAYSYTKDTQIIVISDIFLDEESANALGKTISENQMTCVVKQYTLKKENKQSIEEKKYEAVLKELESK